jgi:hypothetical protein
MKMIFPENLSINLIKKFFKKKNLQILIESSKKKVRPENQLYWTPTLAPNLIDLYRLYQFIVLNKRTTVLEFGSGWSTLVISMALKEVKEKYNKVVKKFNLRRNNLFELFCVDNEKKYLNITKKRIFNFNRINKISKPIKVHYNFSDCLIEQFEGRYSTFYKRIPLCNPDFIYLDGPNLFNIKNKINNFTTAHPDMMPMGNDIIKIEYFLTPGTIILTDGRSANAKFLRDFFKRKWLYDHEKNFDQHIFYLNDPILGNINQRQVNFYKKK